MKKLHGAPLVLAVLAATACASSGGQQALSPVYQPSFDYEPPERAEVAEAEITIALLQPQWPDDIPVAWRDVATEFERAMSKDFEELLTARGFTVKGPYDTHDRMVYSEKEGSHLLLIPELRVTGRFQQPLDVEHSTEIVLLGDNKEIYKIRQGSVTLGGSVSFVVSEPFTQEKLWVQSIDLPDYQRSFAGELKYEAAPAHPFGEPQFQTAVNETLEEIYGVIMKESWDRIEPNQLTVLKGEAMEIREKAGYTVSGG